jgi:phosphoglycolate phosphatase
VPLTTLFFDLDGTVSNNLVGITRCLNFGLTQLGYQALSQPEVLPFVGPPFRDSLPRKFPGIDVERALHFYRERYDTHGWLENDLYDGVAESIRSLYMGGYTVALCTSKPRVFAERIIEHFGLTRYFNGIHGPELDGRFDRKTELLAHLVAQYNVSPQQAVMIGDRDKDIEAAQHAGTHSLGVLWGFGSREELHRAGAAQIIDTPLQLADTIRAFE